MAGNVYKVERAVTAIQLESMKSGRASPFPSQCPTNEKEQTGVIEKYDARNRQCWDKTKYAELGISDHYTNVAALIIHWARDLDKDLKCTEEVRALLSAGQSQHDQLTFYRQRSYMPFSATGCTSTPR